MIFTTTQLLALAPILILAAGIVGLMLLIAVTRNHAATAQLTTFCFLVAAASVGLSDGALPITPLLISDELARVASVLMLGAGALLTLLSFGYMETVREDREEFYLLLLIAALGAVTLCMARHVASFMIGLELMAVSLFGLIAYTRAERRSLEAAFKYLVLSAAASATLLFGFALIYAAGGALSFTEMRAAGTALQGQDLQLSLIGAALVWVGVGFKLSLVPFHLWTADVYEGAPAPVTALLASLSKGAVAVVLLRWLAAEPPGELLTQGLCVVAIATMLIGNLLALLADNVKRLLAYSSIAHFGYLLVPFLVGGELVQDAVLVYLAAYFIMTLGTFGVVIMLSASVAEGEADHLHDYRGLFWRRPYLTSVMTPMLLALAGIPLTAGFLAKFYVLAAGVDQQAWWLVGAVVLGSAIALYYYLRLIIVMFLPHPETEFDRVELTERTLTSGVVLAVLFIALFWLGALPAGPLELLHAGLALP